MTGDSSSRVSSGISGLDELLHGGFLENRSYMISGESGTGKTILGYHFLVEGVRQDESTLYVAFEESEADLRANARSVGIDLDAVSVLDLSTDPDRFVDDATYSVFSPGEVEGRPVAEQIVSSIDSADPDRVFIDPLNKLRHLTPDDYQFEQTAAGLIHHLKGRDATVLFSAQTGGSTAATEDLQYLCDGAMRVSQSLRGRTLQVLKFRGSGFKNGKHAMTIDGDGVEVFPKLSPNDYATEADHDYSQLSTGVDRLDTLLGGGIERGTVTVIAGPSGVGKTTVGTSILTESAANGQQAALYLFEESPETFGYRSAALGYPIESLAADGSLTVEGVEPLELSADEFAQRIRREVDANDTDIVMIDGIRGYQLSLHDDADDLVRELHALSRYLKREGVAVILTDETAPLSDEFRPTGGNISYLADNILFLRYLELDGRIQKAAAVLKKRFSGFEPTVRQFRITTNGIEVGEPLDRLRGILSGSPEWVDDASRGR